MSTALPFDVETARTMLAIEAKTWLFAGRKEAHVRDALDVTMTRYYQLLNVLLDTELALQLDPITTKRLRQIRTTRQRSRTLRRTG